MDSWQKWRIVCLSILSVEDVEDVYIIGCLITGFLLFGVGGYLAYREIRKTSAAVLVIVRLPGMITGRLRFLDSGVKWDKSWRKLFARIWRKGPGIWLFGFAIEKHQRDSRESWKRVTAAAVPTVLLALTLISIFVWIMKNKVWKKQPRPEARQVPREQMKATEENVVYAAINFTKKHDDQLYSNIRSAQSRRHMKNRQEEMVEYSSVNFDRATAAPR
ncbi:hypothetical protein ILYODFUR_008834 [Ilyodon furcidens]|uniref:Uncharacterized protein n=1 Tax=Ilyodon furcidens TaxID=33524 RepID=A0ABV0TU72_9TELE